MENKLINVKLITNDESHILQFDFDEPQQIAFENNDSNCIKKLFKKLAYELRFNSIHLDFQNESEEDLFFQASKEYIDMLNEELRNMETNDELKFIRQRIIDRKNLDEDYGNDN